MNDELRFLRGKNELLEVLDSYPEAVRSLPEARKMRNELARVNADVGLSYIDFGGVNAAGDTLSVSSVIRDSGCRYLLLDFWASWCNPCRRAIPKIKDIYDMYRRQGLCVLGVSMDGDFSKDRNRWRRTLESENIDWPQMILHLGMEPDESEVWVEYGLLGIPFALLVDCSSGVIIGKNLSKQRIDEIIKH